MFRRLTEVTGELEDLGLRDVEPDVAEAFALIKGRIVKGGKEAEDEGD